MGRQAETALEPVQRSTRVLWLILAFAMVFPSISSLADFVWLVDPGGTSNPAQQVSYIGSKVIQFALPVLAVAWFTGRFPRPGRPNTNGVLLGAAFGLIVVAGMLLLYYAILRGSTVFADTPHRVREKMDQFGVGSPLGFAGFALFLTVLHSLLEEYYWRWFVFGRLRKLQQLTPALILSSLGFMAHHVIVLYVFFPGQFWIAAAPFSLCVGIGGGLWAWLFERTGSLYAAWISHLLVDAGLFVIGYDMFFVLQ